MFRREGDRIHIDMSQADFDMILFALGTAAADPAFLRRSLETLNNINMGNPNYTPYKIE